jgi:hypothetical protein
MPPWYAKLVKGLREPPYWSAEYGPDDSRLDIAPRHASDALEITLTALQSIKRVALACEGTPYDLILSYADHALQARPSCGFWVSGDAIATEARRAETLGSVHEGAGRQASPNPDNPDHQSDRRRG